MEMLTKNSNLAFQEADRGQPGIVQRVRVAAMIIKEVNPRAS